MAHTVESEGSCYLMDNKIFCYQSGNKGAGNAGISTTGTPLRKGDSMRNCRFILLAILGLSFAFCWADNNADDQKPPVIKDQVALRDAQTLGAAEAKALADYVRAVTVARKAAIAKLKVRMDVLTHDGKLDDAVAIQKLIDQLSKPIEDLSIVDVDLIGDPEQANNPFLGDWEKKTGHGWVRWTLKADGTAFDYVSHEHGKWKIENNALYIQWDSQVNMYTLPVNGVIKGHTVPQVAGDDQIPNLSRRLTAEEQAAAQK